MLFIYCLHLFLFWFSFLPIMPNFFCFYINCLVRLHIKKIGLSKNTFLPNFAHINAHSSTVHCRMLAYFSIFLIFAVKQEAQETTFIKTETWEAAYTHTAIIKHTQAHKHTLCKGAAAAAAEHTNIEKTWNFVIQYALWLSSLNSRK